MTATLMLYVALTLLLAALLSRRLERMAVTLPMLMVATGIGASQAGLGLMPPETGQNWIHTVAEITLILILFTDGARIDVAGLLRQHSIPLRLLGCGLPLSILFGTLAALPLLQSLSFWEAAVLAAVLAPTDAALSRAVIDHKGVPARLRQALKVESGLNDGMALPFVLILLCAASAQHTRTAGYWLQFAFLQMTLGPLAGILTGWLGAKLLQWSRLTRSMTSSLSDLVPVGLAFVAYGLAEALGGNGFISSFCAGLAMQRFAPHLCSCIEEFAEEEGRLLSLLTFWIFGAVLAWPALSQARPAGILYALCSLTAVRMASVAISLRSLDLDLRSRLYLSWFGPRGVASILFGLVVLGEAGRIGGEEEIFNIVMLTVLLSVIAHGLTALPAAKRFPERKA